MKIDLHCHTNASDGALGPYELYERAKKLNIDLLAITDHDSVEAHYFLREYSIERPKLLTGIELSTTWNSIEIHVVGVNFSLVHPKLEEIVCTQHLARKNRSLLIASELAKQLNHKYTKEYIFNSVIDIAKERQKKNHRFVCKDERIQIGRPHFAQWLVNHNYANSIQKAFDRYLLKIKLNQLRKFWPSTELAVQWLNSIGGTPILAHPLRYKITRKKLIELITDFKNAGGQAIEVINSNIAHSDILKLVQLANDFDLKGSAGSDFHSPEYNWIELGKIATMPTNVIPVWKDWI